MLRNQLMVGKHLIIELIEMVAETGTAAFNGTSTFNAQQHLIIH